MEADTCGLTIGKLYDIARLCQSEMDTARMQKQVHMVSDLPLPKFRLWFCAK